MKQITCTNALEIQDELCTCQKLVRLLPAHGLNMDVISQTDMDLSPGYTTNELLARVVGGF